MQRRAPPVLLALVGAALLGAACGDTDPATDVRRTTRDQLRREVAGYREIAPLIQSGVLADPREVIVSVSDSLIRGLLEASFPLTVGIGGGVTMTLTAATVGFEGNVARVDLAGQLRRESFPRVAASVSLRGALDGFSVDTAHVLGARITVDAAAVGAPTGVPGLLGPLAVALLQGAVERSLPLLSTLIPAVAIPVRLDSELSLPAFGESAALQAGAVSAPLSATSARVMAFRDRLWFILHIDRGAFAAVTSAPRPATGGAIR